MASPRFPDCTGALVAGGRATRMAGVPKGLLHVAGEPIAARTLRIFGALFGASLVVANDPSPYAALGVPAVGDRFPGKGAPGGVHAALAAATTPFVFTAACDMPFLSEDAVAWLVARRGGARAVVVRFRGRLEPLHAVWSRECLPVIEAALRAGDPSLQELARAVSPRVVEEEEWRAIDPAGRSLENANTPEDARRLGLEPDGR
ncbi:MAG TPA: molybdenum cofactor guanylyltransferase [Anaeromyxobacteraceae bacterium]|nr:molybdenum cofactor guanylyltransferase [Anaeromyxobacteraceae bacterium]